MIPVPLRVLFVPLLFCLAVAQSGWASDLKDVPPFAAPQFSLRDLEGRMHRLADYQGRMVLVHFWATWCPPCMDEMLALEALEQRLGRERLIVLAINIGESREKIRQFMEHMSLGLTVLRDTDMAVFSQWRGKVVPSTWVVDGRQQVRAAVVGDLLWDDGAVVKRLEALGRSGKLP